MDASLQKKYFFENAYKQKTWNFQRKKLKNRHFRKKIFKNYFFAK
jgi:hypothetical protein